MPTRMKTRVSRFAGQRVVHLIVAKFIFAASSPTGSFPGPLTLENSDSGREVVDPPGGLERRDNDAGRGYEIVGESVVEVALYKGEKKNNGKYVSIISAHISDPGDDTHLKLENVLDGVKLLLVAIPGIALAIDSIEYCLELVDRGSHAMFGCEPPRATSPEYFVFPRRGSEIHTWPTSRGWLMDSPGRELLERFLLVLGTHASRGAEAAGGEQSRHDQSGSGSQRLGAGDHVGAEEGAASSDSDDGGRHWVES